MNAQNGKKKTGLIGIIIAVIAVVVLVVLIIVDGGKNKKSAEEPAAPTVTESVEPSKAAEPGEDDPAEVTDPAAAMPTLDLDFAGVYAKYAPDTVVYTLNGTDVKWSEYYCWLYSVIGQLTNYYGITDWTTMLDEASGLTVADYILEYAEGMGGQYTLLHGKADELGIRLDAEGEAKVQELMQQDADNYYGGDIAALKSYLAENFYTEEYYNYMNAVPVLYEEMFRHYYGEDGKNLSEADVQAFLDEHGYFHAKHILLETVDESNAALDEEAVAAKKAQAEALLAELKAVPADELDAKFNALMAEYSEDPGSASMKDGYYFQSGEMVPEFEAAAAALADGEISDIVESVYGYHILYRPAMNVDDLFDYDEAGNAVSVRHAVANGLFSNMINGWAEEMEVVYTPEFEDLDLFKLFDIA